MVERKGTADDRAPRRRAGPTLETKTEKDRVAYMAEIVTQSKRRQKKTSTFTEDTSQVVSNAKPKGMRTTALETTTRSASLKKIDIETDEHMYTHGRNVQKGVRLPF